MSTPGPVETLAQLVGDALSPFAERLQGPGAEQVIEALGLRLPAGSLGAGNVAQALQASAGATRQLPADVATITRWCRAPPATIGGSRPSSRPPAIEC